MFSSAKAICIQQYFEIWSFPRLTLCTVVLSCNPVKLCREQCCEARKLGLSDVSKALLTALPSTYPGLIKMWSHLKFWSICNQYFLSLTQKSSHSVLSRSVYSISISQMTSSYNWAPYMHWQLWPRGGLPLPLGASFFSWSLVITEPNWA
jgi:hypothetical protein